jgi:hypothetical protein
MSRSSLFFTKAVGRFFFVPAALLLAAFGLLFWLVMGGAQAAENQGSMNQDQIKQALVGKPIEWKSLDGSLGVYGRIIFKNGGDVVMTTNIPGLEKDQGRWWMTEDLLCTRWSSARDGADKCYRVIDQGAGRYLTTGGNQFEIVGDPMV